MTRLERLEQAPPLTYTGVVLSVVAALVCDCLTPLGMALAV